MSPVVPVFTYSYGANPAIDFPRLLISDTQQYLPDGVTPGYVFADQEITAMTNIVQSQFQSGMFWPTPGGAPSGGTEGTYLPAIPVPYYRIAAMLLTAIASNKARLASVVKLLDVTLAPEKAAKALLDGAKAYLDADDNSGAFMIIEQVNDGFSFRDRWWKQWQRQSAQ